MSILSQAGDMIYAFRFLRMLTTTWEETKAFELGIIDKNGKVINKPKTPAEKEAYSIFHRLVFNIKRLLEKVPFGKTRLASYAAALFLIKEHTGLSEKQIQKQLDKAGYEFDHEPIKESWYVKDDVLLPGRYMLTQSYLSPTTGEEIARKNTMVLVGEECKPIDTIFGAHIYEVKHINTKQSIFVVAGDLVR